MMALRITGTLPYRNPRDLEPSSLPFKLFWPTGLILFVLIVILESGIGWSSVIAELCSSGPVLALWLTGATGWGLIARRLVIWRRPTLPADRALASVSIIAVGLGIISLASFGLGLIGWLNRATGLILLIAGAVMAVGFVVRRRAAFTLIVETQTWAWLLMLPLIGLTFTASLLPAGVMWGMDEPNGYDVVEYHLQVPREWFEAGRIVPLTHNVFSFFPFNVEMHYLLGMHVMGGPWAAQFACQLMHAVFVGLSVAAVYAAVSTRGRGSAIVAALLAASAPWLPMVGSIAYDEGGLLLYGTLAIAWTMRGISRARPDDDQAMVAEDPLIVRRFVIAGVMAGFACGCKLTAVPLVLVAAPCAAMVVLAMNRRHQLARGLIGVILGGVVGLTIFSPWLIRNAALVGNPVFPEQQRVLGRGYFTPEQSNRFYRAHKPRPDQAAVSARIAELWRQTFADFRFGYAVLPLGIAAMLITLRSPRSQLLFLMLLGLTAFWLIETHLQGRFYILAIPIASMATAEVRGQLMRRAIVAIAGLAVVNGFVQTQFAFNQLADGFAQRTGHDLHEIIGFGQLDSSVRFGDTPLAGQVVLVGDATAFSYHVPMTQLHYRTVFDVAAGANDSAIVAWCAGLPAGSAPVLWIDPNEVDRLHRTYGTPPLESSIAGPRDRPFAVSLPAGAVR